MTEPAGRKKYGNAPIEEALVEFRFAPGQGQEWDPTLPGKLHDHADIKNSYPGKPRRQKIFQAALQAEAGQPPGFAVQESFGRVQLVDASPPTRLVSVGPDVLSVNTLRPYDGWESFRPRVSAAVRAYAEISGVAEVNRVGVRYINKIVLPGTSLELGQYFQCGPLVVEGLPRVVAGS
jgi:uncharacterized protein (TIGR04255 family)